MNFCRICRTEQNLKYAPEQLIKNHQEKIYSRAENEIMDENACTLGNICYECEERLLSFSKLSDALDLDADSGRGETPVIVDDDDELLYNFFFEKMKLHQQMQQQQQQHLNENRSSSENDAEIKELMTSRSTSSYQKDNENKQQPEEEKQKVIDFIDLVEESSCSGVSEISTKPCKVEPKIVPNNKKRKRQKYFDESKINLLAKLNLVSSDSEADEACTSENWQSICQARKKIETTKEQKVVDTDEYHIAKKHRPTERANNIDEQNKCPVCHMTYTCNKSLVHHMRNRHRDNEEETALRECERLEQDSALTIRLCYELRSNSQIYYFECQLCGCIDIEYKEHEQHVIDKHSAELRSLKDPLLKLQCPICNKECGGQYIELCRHLLAEHRRPQYKLYLTELNSSAKVPGVIKKYQNKVKQSARIIQLNNVPYSYLQCRQCGKISSNYGTFRKHMEIHEFEMKVDNQLKENQIRQRPMRQHSSKIAIEKCNKSKSTETSKQIREKNKNIKAVNAKPGGASMVKASKVVAKTSKVNFAKPIVSKAKTVVKRGRKFFEKNINVGKLPVMLQVPTQIYECDYCCLSFEGFLKFNFHIIMTHVDKEFYKCQKCAKNFSNKVSLNVHEKSHEIIEINGRIQRRKRIGGTCLTLDENSNAAKAACCKLISNNSVDFKNQKPQKENSI